MSKQKRKTYTYEEHGMNPDLVDLDAKKIIFRLQRNGHEAYVVGGGVRDILLNKPPKDFDIATSATPTEIKRLFNNSRIIGKRFKLVHIYFKNRKIIEVATFRQESEEENEKGQDNVYGTLATDALRRDLTINALFYDPSEEIIYDFVGGYTDLQKRLIRIVGDATTRYEEDPVRILRTLRHMARSGFKLHADAKRGIKATKDLLVDCPTMRIYEELMKDLSSGYFQEIFSLLRDHKVLKIFIPEITDGLDNENINRADLMACIKGIDRAALEGKLRNTTVPLTVLGLFMIPEFNIGRGLHHFFKNQSAIQEFNQDFYTELHVPKKIKLNIVSVIKMLWVLDKTYATGRKLRLSHQELLPDLKQVLNIININKQKSYLNRLVKFS